MNDHETSRGDILLRTEAVSRWFVQDHQRITVLSDVSLELRRGELVALVGPSGAGKSTLLQIIGGLDHPSSGKIWHYEHEIGLLEEKQLAKLRNRHIGFVFQFHHLLSEFTALENVMMPALLAGENKTTVKDKASVLLAQVGLENRVTHLPSELSGGEQQRVALARALMMNPPLVLADEPTGNLDSQTSGAIHDLMMSLNREMGTAFFVVTHSEALAARMPRRITLQDGRIVSDVTQKSSK